MMRFLKIVFLWCITGMSWANILVEIEPHEVTLGETFRVTLTVNEAHSGIPDLTPLQKDFSIIGTERNISYTVLNGQARAISQWSVLLTARKIGTLTIPALAIGQQQSPSQQIMVKAANTQPSSASTLPITKDTPMNTDKPVILMTHIDQAKPYLNQQVIYTVKLLSRERLLNIEYQPPQVSDAVLMSLGQSHHYQSMINGYQYEVDEQSYAIFPQKSGVLQIKPPVVNGLIYDFVPRQMTVHAKPTALTVQPIPSQYSAAHWLPAQQVTLSELYDRHNNDFLVGSTLVRTITLRATALPAQLLPALNFNKTSQFNVYPENAESESTIVNQQLIGTSTIKVTYLLNAAGHITLPAIQVPWFNTMTQQMQLATLPAKSIVVDAKTAPATLPVTPLATQHQAISWLPQQEKWLEMGWIIIGVVLLLLSIYGVYWMGRRVMQKRGHHRLLMNRLQQACLYNQPLQARAMVLQWARYQWPDHEIMTLMDVMKLTQDTSLNKNLQQLTQALYDKSTGVWQGKDLWHAIQAFKPVAPVQRGHQPDELLQPLHKH